MGEDNKLKDRFVSGDTGKSRPIRSSRLLLTSHVIHTVDTNVTLSSFLVERANDRVPTSPFHESVVAGALRIIASSNLRALYLSSHTSLERLLSLSQFHRPSLRTPRNARNASSELEAGFQPTRHGHPSSSRTIDSYLQRLSLRPCILT